MGAWRKLANVLAPTDFRTCSCCISSSCTMQARFAHFPAPMMALLKACLQPDAAKRPSAEELLAFDYFKGVEASLPRCVIAVG